MKRCRSWLLLYAALIGLVGHVSTLRATSLIFGKQLTTSTTTTVASAATISTTTTTIAPVSVDENITEESSDKTDSSKPVLTGIPQIDYIWDPNLPRELNGYNLTKYPFLSTPPTTEEEVGFKCDGLHDGFYASVKWNCQLYHHCLGGFRSDFLCANFTAFDQKTFICHFVSEVDCKNSAKYWFRNDALYVATTAKPTPSTAAPVTQPSISATPARPYGNRRRRPLRRRPQIDYYEDDYAEEYEDPPPPPPPRRRKNQKPRNRRPDFDDYTVNSRGSYTEDDQYEARPLSSDRNRNRQDDDYLYERPINRNRNKANRRKPQYDYEDRPLNEPERRRKQSPNDRRKIVDDEDVERRPTDRRKYNDDRRIIAEDDVAPKRQYEDDYEERPIRKNKPPPPREDPIDDVPQVKPTSSGSSGSSIASLFNSPRRPPKINRPVPLNEKKKFEYTTSKASQSLPLDDSEYYDDYEDSPPPPPPPPQRPRKPAAIGGGQKIKEPAVIQEEITNKRAVSNSRPGRIEPKPFKRPAVPIRDEEYEDDYVDRNPPPLKKRPIVNNEYEERVPLPSQKRPQSNVRDKSNPLALGPPSQQQSPIVNRNRFKESEELVEPDKKLYIREKYSEQPPRGAISQPAENPLILKKDNYNIQSGAPDYRDYTNRQQDNEKYINSDREIGPNTSKITNSNQQKPYQQNPLRTPYDEPMLREEDREVRPIVRVVKRPFLPSRGGSPYLPRGLQPVGNNARPFETNTAKNTAFSIKVDSKENQRDYEEEQSQEQSPSGPKRKPTLDEIYDSEYDVTLNDALNPTLKPLTSNNNRYQSTPYSELTFAPSHIRRTHLNPPITSARRKQSRIPVTKVDAYDDDYDY